MPNPILQLKNIHKYFPGVYALKGVSLDIYPGEVHALMGENGAGKSTLIKIISGAYKADEGEYLLDGVKTVISGPRDAIDKKISVIYQELNLAKNLTVAENIYLGSLPLKSGGRIDYKTLYSKAEAVLRELGLDIDVRTKVQYLTIAKQQLVEIAKSIAKEPKIIIMDEPTSALSQNEIECLFRVVNLLKSKGTAVIYVSHKLDEIFALSEKITVLRDGAHIDTCMTRDINEGKLVSMMVGRQLSDMFIKEKNPAGDLVLQVKNLSTDYIHDVSFAVRAGEVVGFSGLMGSGRTELCRALFGLDERHCGEITVGGVPVVKNSPAMAVKLGMGLIPEDRKDEGIFPNLPVRNNMTMVALGSFVKGTSISRGKEHQAVETMIKSINIKTPTQEQKIMNLSGGNQQKVIVARWLIEGNRKVLIVDEPTRGIDVGAKSEIYMLLGQLAKQGMCILVMSSEMPEVMGLTDRIYVLKEGTISGEFDSTAVTQEELLVAAT